MHLCSGISKYLKLPLSFVFASIKRFPVSPDVKITHISSIKGVNTAAPIGGRQWADFHVLGCSSGIPLAAKWTSQEWLTK